MADMNETYDPSDEQRAEEMQRVRHAQRTDWAHFEPIWPSHKLVASLPCGRTRRADHDPYERGNQ
jgi:hypothetical protein